jgi:hypothetical protein
MLLSDLVVHAQLDSSPVHEALIDSPNVEDKCNVVTYRFKHAFVCSGYRERRRRSREDEG